MNDLKFDKEQIKRIIIPGLLLLSFGDRKIIIKSPPSGEKHYTFGLSEESYIDIHETVEGKKKVHKPITKIKIDDLRDAMQKSIPDVRSFRIDLNDRRYRQYQVLVPKYSEAEKDLIRALSTSNGRSLMLKQFSLKEISKFFHVAKFFQIQRYDFERAYGFRPDQKNQSAILLYRVGSDYFAVLSQKIRDITERVLKTVLPTFVHDAEVKMPTM